MNFLQLAQAVKRESGLSGGGPTSINSAVGDDLRIFNWVNWAARDISLAREDWRWRRGTAVAPSTTAAVNSYTAFGLTDFASWKAENVVYKPTAYRLSDGIANEHKLMWTPYDQYRMLFMTGVQTPGPAQYWSISPSEEFLLGPVPDEAHLVRADYVKDFTDLIVDASVPELPTRFHMIVVWRALLEYGGFDAASEVYQRADQNYKLMWTALVQSQLETPTIRRRGLA
jgi:hypothetical protein